MDNPALKKAQGQVSIEFILGFIAILLLFIGGFNIWLGLNNTFVTETKNYQSERLASGQGNITIPGGDVINATPIELDDATLNKILKIQACDCIDDALKNEAVNLYTQQYILHVKVDTYTDVINSLNDSIAGMKNAYNQIPWCKKCCLCTSHCICGWECPVTPSTTGSCKGGYTCSSDGGCSCPEDCVPAYCDCQNSCFGPAYTNDEGLYDYCHSCPTWWWGSWGWGWSSCSLESWSDCSCTGITVNTGHDHTTQRQQIKDSIDSTTEERDNNQDLLDDYTVQKSETDSQIAEIEPQLSCCGI